MPIQMIKQQIPRLRTLILIYTQRQALSPLQLLEVEMLSIRKTSPGPPEPRVFPERQQCPTEKQRIALKIEINFRCILCYLSFIALCYRFKFYALIALPVLIYC
jgi:hypothetical protein